MAPSGSSGAPRHLPQQVGEDMPRRGHAACTGSSCGRWDSTSAGLGRLRRWIARQRAAGQHRRVWLAMLPLAALYIAGFIFIINEEIFTGTKIITLHPAED